MRLRLSAGALAAAVIALGLGSAAAQPAFTPVEPDTLTVATVFPAPGVMEGDTPETLKGGVEWALSKEIAKQLGLSKVKFVNTNFAALISGQVSGYDIAAANIITLPSRVKVNDYTSCYYSPMNAALVRGGVKLATLDDVKKIKWGVLTGSVNETFMLKYLKPDAEPRSYPSPVAMSAALQDGSIEGEYISLQRAAADSKTGTLKDNSTIVLIDPSDAQSTGLCSAVQLPKGSPNLAAVDAVVKKIIADKLVDGWVQQYVVPLLSGIDPSKLTSLKF
jgi:polar amino acid transport system substrate-binding protein